MFSMKKIAGLTAAVGTVGALGYFAQKNKKEPTNFSNTFAYLQHELDNSLKRCITEAAQLRSPTWHEWDGVPDAKSEAKFFSCVEESIKKAQALQAELKKYTNPYMENTDLTLPTDRELEKMVENLRHRTGGI